MEIGGKANRSPKWEPQVRQGVGYERSPGECLSCPHEGPGKAFPQGQLPSGVSLPGLGQGGLFGRKRHSPTQGNLLGLLRATGRRRGGLGWGCRDRPQRAGFGEQVGDGVRGERASDAGPLEDWGRDESSPSTTGSAWLAGTPGSGHEILGLRDSSRAVRSGPEASCPPHCPSGHGGVLSPSPASRHLPQARRCVRHWGQRPCALRSERRPVNSA